MDEAFNSYAKQGRSRLIPGVETYKQETFLHKFTKYLEERYNIIPNDAEERDIAEWRHKAMRA